MRVRLFAKGQVLVKEASQAPVVLFVVFVILVLASSLMCFAEDDAKAEFSSIPAAMW